MKNKITYLIFLTVLIILSGCEKKEYIADELSKEAMEIKRVIALSSSISEIWLLSGGELIGVTSDALGERDLGLPQDIPVVGTVKDPNIEKILSLNPDLVLLSEDITSHTAIKSILEEMDIGYYSVKVETFEEYIGILKDFTELTGDYDSFVLNGLNVEEDVKILLENIPQNNEFRPTALFLRAYSSGIKIKASDHTVCYILDDIGVENIAANKGFPLEDLSLEAIIESDPDYIFLVMMGDEEAATENIKKSLAENSAWQQLSAVKNDKLIILPKNLYHYKPNNRWGEAYEGLLQIIYPEQYK